MLSESIIKADVKSWDNRYRVGTQQGNNIGIWLTCGHEVAN